MLAQLTLVLTLAAAGSGRAPGERTTEAWRVLMWVLLLIIAFVVMFWLAIWFRRQFVGGSGAKKVQEAVGFSIADLRRMREEGRISQQEFELTRERLVHSARVAMAQSSEDDRVPADAPLTKDVDLIREAER